VAETGTDGTTVEQQLVDVLVHEAPRGGHRLAAVEAIFDHLEGRARQEIEVAGVARELRQKSDDELRFHLEHDHWPEDDELPESAGRQNDAERFSQLVGRDRRRSSLFDRCLLYRSRASRQRHSESGYIGSSLSFKTEATTDLMTAR
jgi:hypothetical protein